MERQAELIQQAARLTHEAEQRRHLEALLDEGLQVQTQILLGLQVICKAIPRFCRTEVVYSVQLLKFTPC